MIKISDGVLVFLSQLESYIHRGENFECLSPIEFEYIVDIKKSNDSDEDDSSKKEENREREFVWGKIIH